MSNSTCCAPDCRVRVNIKREQHILFFFLTIDQVVLWDFPGSSRCRLMLIKEKLTIIIIAIMCWILLRQDSSASSHVCEGTFWVQPTSLPSTSSRVPSAPQSVRLVQEPCTVPGSAPAAQVAAPRCRCSRAQPRRPPTRRLPALHLPTGHSQTSARRRASPAARSFPSCRTSRRARWQPLWSKNGRVPVGDPVCSG